MMLKVIQKLNSKNVFFSNSLVQQVYFLCFHSFASQLKVFCIFVLILTRLPGLSMDHGKLSLITKENLNPIPHLVGTQHCLTLYRN